MARCEDFPCCGHEPGDCPDAQGRMKCIECGGRLPKNATSSMHPRCQMAYLERVDVEERGGYFHDREDW